MDDDRFTITIHRINHFQRLRVASTPLRDVAEQSTLDGTTFPHRRLKQLRKQYNFRTVDEFVIDTNKKYFKGGNKSKKISIYYNTNK